MAEPALPPVTFPDTSTDALALLLLHVPPAVASLTVIIVPTHSDNDPWIDNGAGFTVATWVVTPQPVVV